VIGVVGVDTFFTGFPYPKDDVNIEKFVKPFKADFSKAAAGMVRSMFPSTTDQALVEDVLSIIQAADQKMAVDAMYDVFYWNRNEVPGSLNALGNRLRNINGEPVVKSTELHPGVKRIAGAGHFVHMEKPSAFNKVLADFVKELARNK